MNKIQKFIKKLQANERAMLMTLVDRLKSGRFVGLDIKKLKGHSSLFRLRKGDFRIIFEITSAGLPPIVEILDIAKRDGNTYADY